MNEILTVVIVLCAIGFVAFTFVILFGAPFLPTLKARTNEALDLLDLQPGQTLLELGSGDGRILRAAAERGIYSIGYELNPFLVWWSMARNLKYRRFITVRWANYWRHPLPLTDGIYVFLLKPFMEKLHTKITQEITRPVKVVSFGFEIPGKKPRRQRHGLFLYEYQPEPAKA